VPVNVIAHRSLDVAASVLLGGDHSNNLAPPRHPPAQLTGDCIRQWPHRRTHAIAKQRQHLRIPYRQPA